MTAPQSRPSHPTPQRVHTPTLPFVSRRLLVDPPPPLDERARWVDVHEGAPTYLEVPAKADTAYLTHGLFRYVGKLPPPLVAFLLANYTESDAVVLDPMCGGGTTAIEAVTSGRQSINFDLNPVPLLITEAMTSPVEPGLFDHFVARVLDRARPMDAPTALQDYFSPESYGVLRSGLDLARTPAQKALVLSVARKASFANTKKINTVVDQTKTPKPAQDLLVSASRAFEQAFEQLAATTPTAVQIERGKATQLPLADGSVQFVLLHPPYLTNTAFSEVTHLQLLLLGHEPKKIQGQELAYRGSYFHVPNGLKKYLIGWAKILGEAARVTEPGGTIAAIVGDGSIDHVRIPVGTLTQEFAEDAGLKTIERCEHRLNNQTGWTLSRRMSSQHVLVFRK